MKLPVVYFDDKAATMYEKLLLQKLRIGTQDLLIASIALSQNAVLLTRNDRDSHVFRAYGLMTGRFD